ncbi:hypothetical protein [Flavobacterium sediminis]|uniref:hypothetical protein n=1 Tax=Flavobacterium sediminis TaxID=2201181 RepID=UPI0011B1EB45|nr:hypothetical protein [Flavobacterium sediminis]
MEQDVPKVSGVAFEQLSFALCEKTDEKNKSKKKDIKYLLMQCFNKKESFGDFIPNRFFFMVLIR